MSIMAVVILPVAVSVHTIVSFDFSMAPVPMWQSTVFGPYFVAGAIFSGIAGLIIAMAFLRKFLHLETYLQPVHFENLGKLLLVMAVLWGYFVFNERLVTYYGNEPAEMAVFWRTQRESFAPLYWTMVTCNFVLPLILMGIKYTRRTITGCVIASLGVVVGMWLERFLIIVPSLGHKYLPYAYGIYRPRLLEVIDRRRDVRGDYAAVRALRQGRADHLDVGTEDAGARAWRRPRARRRGRRWVRCGREGGLRALRRRPRRAAGGEPPARCGAEGSGHHGAVGPADGGVRVRQHGQGHLDVVDRLRRRPRRHGRGLRAGLDHGEFVADERRRPAHVRVVAEPDHHVRADDAGRDRRHRHHAGRDRRLRTGEGPALRPGSLRRQDPGGRREPVGRERRAVSSRPSACRPTRRSRPSSPSGARLRPTRSNCHQCSAESLRGQPEIA